jgi:hypothetical protein
MKILWYGLTLVLGLFGLLSLLRFFELQLTTGSFYPIQLVMAIICLGLAYKCLVQARRA